MDPQPRMLNRGFALFATIAAIASIAILLAGCNDTDPDEDTVGERPTNVDPPDSATPLPNNAEEYAAAVVIAWSRDDGEMLSELVSEEAYEVLESRGWNDDDLWQPTGCDGAAGTVNCQWRAEDGETLQLQVDDEAASNSEPHAVVAVRFN